MIAANELRIGNIIAFDDGSTDIVKVNWVFNSSDMWFVQWKKITGNGSYASGNSIIDDFKPVNITSEVLSKCGFIKVKGAHTSHVELNNFFLQKLSVGCLYKSYHREVLIKHVHQLQNLYYSLVGKELIITL